MKPKLVKKSLQVLGLVAPHLTAEIAIRIFTTPKRIARPEGETKLLAKGTTFITRQGLSMTRWGDGERRVLLVHGWEGRGSQLGALVEPLLTREWTRCAHKQDLAPSAAPPAVFAIDGPAHGDSPGHRTNARVFADAIVDASQEIGPFTAIVAHSYGVGVTSIALRRGLRVDKLVLVAAPSNFGWVINNFCSRLGFSQRVAAAFKHRLAHWSGIHQEDSDLTKTGVEYPVPALIVHDPADQDVPYFHAEAIAGSWPGAQLLAISGVGHRRILKAPAFVDGVLDFLKDR